MASVKLVSTDPLIPSQSSFLAHGWHHQSVDYHYQPLHSAFEAQVSKTPDEVALVLAGQTLSYRELNSRANRLAHALREQLPQAGADTLIGLYLDRSMAIMVAILAVLKAGWAYVPVSVYYPAQRSRFIFKDTGCACIISESTQLAALTNILTEFELTPTVLDIDEYCEQGPDHDPEISTSVDDLAYVFYTSGTTGQPKGVMVEHKAVMNTVLAMNKVYDIGPGQRKVGFFSEYVFDVSVSEMFNCLLFGGELYIFDGPVKADPQLLAGYINEHELNYVFIPPVMLAQLPKQDFGSLKALIFAGEACDHQACLYWAERYPLYNCYGPTEAAIYASYKRADVRDLNEIGRPLDNVRLYVLDSKDQPVPVGEVGELYIGGAGLARGYLNRDDLTASAFIEGFGERQERLYKTGDLVRWTEDGYLKYIGRNDQQVSIRGYRVEPGEIAAVLSEHPAVEQAVVISRDNKLVAYYTGAKPLEPLWLRDHLLAILPDYMVPEAFEPIAEIPLTVNGKLDRKALPAPGFHFAQAYQPPRNGLERQLCEVWQRVLRVDSVGIDDNFFALGGHSITAIELSVACSEALSQPVPLNLLMDNLSVAQLAANLGDSQAEWIIAHDLQSYPLSFAQERLLFIERYEGGTTAYHIPYLIELAAGTALAPLQTALSQVIARHPILKTVFVTDKAQDRQQVLVDDIVWQYRKLADVSALGQAVQADIAQPFDLSRDGGVRLVHYEHNDGQYVLILFHHIAFDGWSMAPFINELREFYCGRGDSLGSLSISYGDFALWQRDWLEGDNYQRLLDYWLAQLDQLPTLALPLDYPRPAQFDYAGEWLHLNLDSSLSGRLQLLARQRHISLYSLLLAGFSLTMGLLAGQDDVVIGSPADNRDQPQVQSLVGFFVNALVMRSRIDRSDSIDVLLAQVHQTVLDAKVHQALPFEQLVDALQVERQPSHHPLFQVMFTLQDFNEVMDNPAELPFKSVDLTRLDGIEQTAKFDLTVFMSQQNGEIRADINYASRLFNGDTVCAMAQLFERVLRAFADDSRQTIADIQWLSDAERQTLLEHRQPKWAPVAAQTSLYQLFARQVAQHPNAVAVTDGNTSLSYQALKQKADGLALCLGQLAPDTPVALYMDRSIDMVTAMLAVLGAGGAYVPISPKLPKQRVMYVLADTAAKTVIAGENYLTRLDQWLTQIPDGPALVNGSQTNGDGGKPLMVSGNADDLAYIMYTSGTSGKPKGVMITHRGVISLVQADEFKALGGDDVVLHLSDPGFDAATFEIWGALTKGATLSIAPSDLTLSAQAVGQLLSEQQISVAWFTRALFDALFNQQPQMFARLSYLLVGGEALTPAIINRLVAMEQRPTMVLNGYGPTESTTFTTLWPCESFVGSAPLGKPLSSRLVYVLDEHRQLVPPGAPGELYIGGEGLARGYLNQPGLTDKRFVDNPFGSGRLYKSGDKVRWGRDGNLQYLGRMDLQLKVRGYRIEVEEIEHQLQRLDDIHQACVVAKRLDETTQLIAYCRVNADTAQEQVVVADWETLYQDLYKDQQVNTFDISGWNSSFTGEAIPAEEMLEWRDATVARIAAHQPHHVLEIGCGTGLLLYGLIEQLDSYRGVDFSAAVVNRLNASFVPLEIDNARVSQGRADQVSETDLAGIDTVVINSVVQYFPNLTYLDNVLSLCLSQMRQGRIFVGDVRDLRLLGEFRQATGRSDSETELLLHPAYLSLWPAALNTSPGWKCSPSLVWPVMR